MITIDINHPDVMDFIKIKRDLTQITGANISIKLNDDFMKAVENDEDYILRFPTNLQITDKHSAGEYNVLIKEEGIGYVKKIKAKEYWDEIIKSAHSVAEPGLMFWNRQNEYSTSNEYPDFENISTNPCGEIAMNNDSCRLMVVNLFSFVNNPFTKEAKVDFGKLYEVVYESQRLMDDLVDLELNAVTKIIDKIKADEEPEFIKKIELDTWTALLQNGKKGRRTGLGITAVGDFLAALNLPYDSNEAIELLDMIASTKLQAEWDSSIDMSIERGSFPIFDKTVEDKSGFIQMLKNRFPELYKRNMEHGRRNISISTIAPTGSVSILTQTTSGIEPLFKPYYIRRKKINPDSKNSKVDFVDKLGDKWEEFIVLHPKFKDWISTTTDYTEQVEAGIISSVEELSKPTLQSLFEQSPWFGSTADKISWRKRINIQSTFQNYITHSISSTINLPEDVPEYIVSEIYFYAWKAGLKGITIYREGSRSGVLIDSSKTAPEFKYNDALKRPTRLECDIHHIKIKGVNFTVIVGLLNNNPYEVFAIEANIAKDFTKGLLVKKSKGIYNLVTTKDEEVIINPNITSNMSDVEAALTRLISTALRHGANINFIVEQLLKIDGNITSFSKVIARVLKIYTDNVRIYKTSNMLTCTNCSSNNLKIEEGCVTCVDCGNSKCT